MCMEKITLKTIARKTTVSRAAVRDAISTRFCTQQAASAKGVKTTAGKIIANHLPKNSK